MNFSTNQVKQLYVLGSSSVVTLKSAGKASFLTIDGDRTDLIPHGKVLHTGLSLATEEGQLLRRKGVLVKLNPDVNAGAPVNGQSYVLRLTYRGHIGEEDTYHKFAEARATRDMTAAQLLQKLALSLFTQVGVEESPLYELYVKGDTAAASTKITSKGDCAAITEKGFYIVEPVPFWALGKFPETLLKIELTTAPITIDGVEETQWLASYKFSPIKETVIETVKPIVNTHRIADLEYFCKGERGISAGLHVPYEIQIPLNLKVNASNIKGYDVLNIHYAFQGANQQSTLSEKDITLVAPSGTTFSLNGASGKKLSDVKTAIEAL